MIANKFVGVASAVALSLVGGAVFAAPPSAMPPLRATTTPHSVTLGSGRHSLTLGSGPFLLNPNQTSNGKASPSNQMPGNHNPASLTAQPDGNLTFMPTAGGYNAVWTWSGLTVGQQVLLIGDSGSTVSLNPTPPSILQTKIFAMVTTPGTATFFIPSNQYFGTKTSPETFEAFALFASTPVGQMPEVPFAAGLPLAALAGVAGLFFWSRRQRAL